jgi:hypothetical protein
VSLDPLIESVRVVRPRHDAVETRDLAIADGRFTRVEPVIDASLARAVFDARGPGRPARGQGRPPAPLARLGFGGLLSGGFSEGSRRPGMACSQVLEAFAGGFIHSYPQDFPHPQPTHILGIIGRDAPTRGGDSEWLEAEKVHVDKGLRFD